MIMEIPDGYFDRLSTTHLAIYDTLYNEDDGGTYEDFKHVMEDTVINSANRMRT
eukprot:CAMPEP_0116897208 /NCGR_PEP_ID=MMETSP0467-20121206/6265_1 /TAXON_ID=283647 /ORGANISM="Mesodinium pulex, Strain SPMC105" /LENGTH=53 /DNA_ID=CAMNT_0004568775 /DNA_START=1463 /DNA_END=1624 /DNA_ORIENTATION=-